jgi:drug/metabolite transporter (DMT)-like permease
MMAFLVLVRVVLSVSTNAIQKRLLLDGAGVNQTWILTYLLMLGPATLAAVIRPFGGGALFWRDILVGGGLDAIGNLAMVAALRGTDVSIFGPLNALRPILALGAGWIFLGETPTVVGFAGIGITFLGAVVLLGGKHEASAQVDRRHLWKMLLLRVAGLSLGTIGAVFLKRAAMQSSAELTVAAWILCGLFVLLVFAITRRPGTLAGLKGALGKHRFWLGTHAAVFVTMQWLTITIFQKTLLAYSFVFFQLGMALQVIVGRVLFKEPAFVRRMIGAIIMSAGSGLIVWKG